MMFYEAETLEHHLYLSNTCDNSLHWNNFEYSYARASDMFLYLFQRFRHESDNTD